VRKHNILEDPLDALGSEPFDVVCSRFMLFHLPGRQERAIRRMVECLRPGGWLVDEDGDWGIPGPVDPSHRLYAGHHRVFMGGEWWTARGYDPCFGRKLPVLFERCGLENIGHEASTEVVRGGSPWALWWQESLDAILGTGSSDGNGTAAHDEDRDALTAPCADPSVWFMRELLHACWGQRPR
jgi:SAM-dependent methyltransferase